jgi:acyl-coenzyme A thioesterase PaaI-like protein
MITANPAVGHEACFVCQQSFCFSSIIDTAFGVESEMHFGSQHEGWQGIPHGGVAMTALLDLADHCWLRRRGKNLSYPVAVEWRFADVVAIGDIMLLIAEIKDNDTIFLSMQRRGSEKIYLKAEVRVGAELHKVDFTPPDPRVFFEPGAGHQALAVYDNCFVCGPKRQQPGLRRRFFKTVIKADNHAGQDTPAVIVRFGGAAEKPQLAAAFQQAPGRLHPGVLAALLDELCGWSGILAGDLYGYTVRFHLDIKRLPQRDEEFFGFSPTPAVKGRGARQFYLPQGVLYRKKEDDSLEIIAGARGQWLAKEELRQQFDVSHIDEELKGIKF